MPRRPGQAARRFPRRAAPIAPAADNSSRIDAGSGTGSWLTPRDALARGDWDRIEALAAEAATLR